MRFFSRLVFICNLSFLASIVLRLVEMVKRNQGNLDPAIGLQALQGTLVILGYGAIFLNLIFFVWALIGLAGGSLKNIPRWLLWFNLVLFPVQIWYFFFANF